MQLATLEKSDVSHAFVAYVLDGSGLIVVRHDDDLAVRRKAMKPDQSNISGSSVYPGDSVTMTSVIGRRILNEFKNLPFDERTFRKRELKRF